MILKKTLCIVLALLCVPLYANNGATLENILYPVVRVTTKQGSMGSGTVIYSKLIDSKKGIYESYIVTCHHVISSSIIKGDYYNENTEKYEPFEERTPVLIEFFFYKNDRIVKVKKVFADIVAYKKKHDLALLRVRTTKKIRFVAKIPTDKKINSLRILDDIYAVGCPLGMPPIPTKGHITSLSMNIEGETFWLTSSPIIYGNSGGALFTKDFYLIGVTARIASYRSGFSQGAVTHLAFSVPITTLKSWLKSTQYGFVAYPSIKRPKVIKSTLKKKKVFKKKTFKKAPKRKIIKKKTLKKTLRKKLKNNG